MTSWYQEHALPAMLAARKSSRADFGTVNGEQSVAEVLDYIAAKDYILQQLGNAFAAYAPTWVNSDTPAFEDWSSDWAALGDRWTKARADAESFIAGAKLNPLPNNMIPASAAYASLQQAITLGAPMASVKGNLQDLNDRLELAQKARIAYPNVPQPKPGSDVDLTGYKVADTVIETGKQVIDDAKKGSLGPIPWLISHWEWVILGLGISMVGIELGAPALLLGGMKRTLSK